MKLADRVALVFGGASGIGQACAVACANEGAAVVVADINAQGGEDAVEEIRKAGGKAAFVQADVTNEESVKAAVAKTVSEFGKLNVLITNAGGRREGDDPGQAWHYSVDMHLKGPYYAAKAVIPEMEKAGGGSIINIASIASFVSGISLGEDLAGTGYPASKHGVVGLTKTIAYHLATRNIRCNAICPGYIRTPAMRRFWDVPDGGMKFLTDDLNVAMKRWGEPSEIGKVAAFLASDDASFITGQPIVVDGGFLLR